MHAKKIRAIQLLLLVICVQQSTLTEIKEPANVFNTLMDDKEQDPAVENNITSHQNNIHDINSNDSNKEMKLLNIDGRLHSFIESATKRPLDKELAKETIFGKRSATMPAEKRLMTVEMFTVIDYSIFSRFFKESKAKTNCKKKQDARRKILYTFTHIMEKVKINYENIEMEGLKFTIKWAGALIAESIKDVPFVENEDSKINSHTIDADSVMEKLKKWELTEKAKGNDNTKLPNYDFLALFTNYDLRYKNKTIHGLASTYEICTSQSIGITHHRDFYSAAVTTTHEAGHVLGIYHDGQQNNCDPKKNFIMSTHASLMDPVKAQNLNHFSRCSPSYLNTTVNRLDSANSNCLADGGVDFNRGRERDIFLHLYPGQIYELDDQCRMLNGPQSYYCGKREDDQELCRIVKCFSGSDCRALINFNALDGTTCANSSWCLKGKCVFDNRAPKAPKHCINGDAKFPHDENNSICAYVAKHINYCDYEFIRSPCCASCERYNLGHSMEEDCLDTIEDCSSLEPRDCYNNYYATTCCQTCRALVQNPHDANCLYGDKGIGCSDLLPTVCHLNPPRYCCQTCAAYLSTTKTALTNSSFSITESVFASKIPLTTIINNSNTISIKNNSSTIP